MLGYPPTPPREPSGFPAHPPTPPPLQTPKGFRSRLGSRIRTGRPPLLRTGSVGVSVVFFWWDS